MMYPENSTKQLRKFTIKISNVLYETKELCVRYCLKLSLQKTDLYNFKYYTLANTVS